MTAIIRVIFAAALVIAGWIYPRAVFACLGMACVSLVGFIVWHCTEQSRERAHVNYARRISTRPRAASEWADDDWPPEPDRPVRDDIVPRPGRRMVALIDDREDAPRC